MVLCCWLAAQKQENSPVSHNVRGFRALDSGVPVIHQTVVNCLDVKTDSFIE